ncbi:MAG TPA: YciI family protein [Micromonosporaceae bacterium]
MKYALLLYFDPDRPAEQRSATNPQIMADWIAYTRAIKHSGALLDAQQLHEVDTATAVRRRDGELMLTDGPFAETKEHLLGFYLIDVPDLDTALDWAGKMPHVGRGTVEVRPVMEGMAWQAVLNE